MRHPDLYPVAGGWAESGAVDQAEYQRLDHSSLDHPDAFWRTAIERLDWVTVPQRFDESDFSEPNFQVRWFADGELNVSFNCLDRHLAERGDPVALI